MEGLSIEPVDLAALAVLLLSGLLAFFRGFIREALAIAAWVGAFLAGAHGHFLLEPTLAGLLPDPSLAPWLSGIAVGVAAVIVLSLGAHFLARTLRIEGLGAIDRSLGFLFGLVRGAAILSLCFLVAQWALGGERGYPGWLSGARSLPLARAGAGLLVGLLPERLRPDIEGMDEEARRAAEALEKARRLERLIDPPVKSDAPDGESGYTGEERDAMDRALERLR